jgi:uncharacterized protein
VTATESVTYRVSHWPAGSREALRWLLVQNGIDATWHDAWFSIPEGQRGAVDAVIASMHTTGAARSEAAAAQPATVPASGGPLYSAAAPAYPPPGWYPDPAQPSTARWWDGRQWTGYVGALPALDRGWFPAPGDREQSARGGGIAVAGFVGGQVASLALVLVAIALGASSRSVTTLIVGELCLWAGLFGACRLAVRRYGTGSLRDLGLVRLRLADLGIGSVTAIVARVGTLVIAAILVLIFRFDDLARDTSVTKVGVSTLGAIVVTVVAVFGAPFFEELYFRGLVQGVLTRRYGGRVAIVVQSVAFGLVHYQIGMTLGQAVLTFAMIMAVGLLLGILRWRYQRLGPGMVAHAVFNAMAVAITLATV